MITCLPQYVVYALTMRTLDNAIARLWEVTPSGKILSISEKHCKAHFVTNYKVSENGRFIVKLPLCKRPEELGESHGVDFNRFLSLERRLAKVPDIKSQYIRLMEEYDALGHMTQIDATTIGVPNYFIPITVFSGRRAQQLS